MNAADMTDGSDYLLLHLMDGVDTIEVGNHEPGTCFRLKLQKFNVAKADSVSGLKATAEKVFLDPLQRLVNEEYFSWNVKTRLFLGNTSATSFLRVTLLKGSQNDDTFGRDGDFGRSHSKRVYAEAEIPIEELRFGQDLRDHANSTLKTSANGAATRRCQQRVEHQLDLKILPKEIEPDEFNSQYHAGAKSTTSFLGKDLRPVSPHSRVRVAEDAYHAELSRLTSSVDPLKKECTVQDPQYIQSIASRGDVGVNEPQRYFRIRFGYILISASQGHSDISASIGDAADIAEVTSKFFGRDSTRIDSNNHASRRSFDVMDHSISIASQPFISERSTASTLKAAATYRVSNKSVGNIYEQLHSMCSSSRFLEASKRGDDMQQTASSQLGDLFLGKEGEIPSRTFIELLRLRVSSVWAERVQGLVYELSGTRRGDCANSGMGVDSIIDSDGKGGRGGVNRNDVSSHSRDSFNTPSIVNDADTIRALKILRDSAQVRVVGRSESGVVSAQLRDGSKQKEGSAAVVTLIRFPESSAIRFIAAALQDESGSLLQTAGQPNTQSTAEAFAEIESLVAASAVEEKALSDFLRTARCSDTAAGETLQHVTDVSNLAECLSRLSIIRTQTSESGSTSNQCKNPNDSNTLEERKKTLLSALMQLDSMKIFCESVSDRVFRSLCGAKKEGGHALLSARCRSLSLPGRIRVNSHITVATVSVTERGTGIVGDIETGTGVRTGTRGVVEGESRGRCRGLIGLPANSSSASTHFTIGSSNNNDDTTLRYRDLLHISRELREVQNIVKKSLREAEVALHTSSVRAEHTGGTAAPLVSAESSCLSDSPPCSPTSRGVRDMENQQWLDRCP